jgi:hypothetical protein
VTNQDGDEPKLVSSIVTNHAESAGGWDVGSTMQHCVEHLPKNLKVKLARNEQKERNTMLPEIMKLFEIDEIKNNLKMNRIIRFDVILTNKSTETVQLTNNTIFLNEITTSQDIGTVTTNKYIFTNLCLLIVFFFIFCCFSFKMYYHMI